MEIAEIHCGARIVTISTQGAGTYIGVVPSRVRSYVSRRFVDAGAVVWLRWIQRGGHSQSEQSVDRSAGSAKIESSGTGHHPGLLRLTGERHHGSRDHYIDATAVPYPAVSDGKQPQSSLRARHGSATDRARIGSHCLNGYP